MDNPKTFRLVVIVLAVLILTFASVACFFEELLTVVNRGISAETRDLMVVMFMVFVVSLFVRYVRVRSIVLHYTQVLFDLSEEEAANFVTAVMYYIPRTLRPAMTLKVHSGKLDPESSATVKKVGGPGYLSVDYEHIVVTSRFGLLHRTLKAGFHKLDPFEKVWDVVDLRPQYREIDVEFMTADGIPACCKANLLFRVENPKALNAFRLTTVKYVVKPTGRNRLSDWTVGIVNGALDGAIRDTLEFYEMDQFINPLDFYNERDGIPDRSVVTPDGNPVLPPFSDPLPPQPVSMAELEDKILAEVRDTGDKRGIRVERLELSEVRPQDKAVLRQWLEIWSTNLYRIPERTRVKAEIRHSERMAISDAELRAQLIANLSKKAAELTQNQKLDIEDMLVSSIVDLVYGIEGEEKDALLKRALLHKLPNDPSDSD